MDDPAVLENAALLGRGVILGSKRFLAERLQSGELITPLGAKNCIAIYYYLYSGSASRRRDVAKFAQWIRAISKEIREKDERDELAEFLTEEATPNEIR